MSNYYPSMSHGQKIYGDSRRGRRRGNNSNPSFTGRNSRDFRRGGHNVPRHVDNDGDFLMVDEGNSNSNDMSQRRFNPYITDHRHHNRRGRRGVQESVLEREFNIGERNRWIRIMLPMAKRVTTEVAIKTISDHVGPFVPFNLHCNGSSIVFFTKDPAFADNLKKASGRIKTTDGFTIRAVIRMVDIPRVLLAASLHERVRNRIIQRYNAEHQVLDLSNFHNDEELLRQHYSLHLSESNIAKVVSATINDSLGPISYLNLKGNNMSTLNIFNETSEKMAELKVLNLDNNKIERLADLSPIFGLPLVDLCLRNNKLRKTKLNDKDHFVE